MDTPLKYYFIYGKLSIRKLGSSSVLVIWCVHKMKPAFTAISHIYSRYRELFTEKKSNNISKCFNDKQLPNDYIPLLAISSFNSEIITLLCPDTLSNSSDDIPITISNKHGTQTFKDIEQFFKSTSANSSNAKRTLQ